MKNDNRLGTTVLIFLTLLAVALGSCESESGRRVRVASQVSQYSQNTKVVVIKCNRDQMSGVYLLKVKRINDSVSKHTASFYEYAVGDTIEVLTSSLK